MSYEFGVGEYVTRDGRKAVVVSADYPGSESRLLGWVSDDSSTSISLWDKKGKCTISNVHQSRDLMPPKAWSAEVTLDGYTFSRKGQAAFKVSSTLVKINSIVDLLNAGEESQ